MKYVLHGVLLLSCLARSVASMAQVAPQVDMSKLYSALSAARVDFKAEDEKTAVFEARRANFRFPNLGAGDEMMAVFRMADPTCGAQIT